MVRHFERQFQVHGDVARNRSMERWLGEWCSYNFAAGSFHTKKLCSRLFSREVDFYWQNSDIAFLCHPLGDLGVTYTVHRWLVGKRVVDFLWVIIELFSLAITIEALWADIGRNCAVWKGGGSLWTQISGGKGRPPPTIFGTRKLESLGYRIMKKIAEKFNHLSRVHQRHKRQTDNRPTDLR